MALSAKGFDPLASLFDAPDRGPVPATASVGIFEDDDTSPTLHPLSQDRGPHDRRSHEVGVVHEDFDVDEPSLLEPELDKVALARALARAAMARAASNGRSEPVPEPEPEPVVPAPEVPEAPSDPSLRLLARARRPTSAQAAMVEAKRREAVVADRAIERRLNQLPREVRRILKRQAPGAQLKVVNALVMDERSKLRALWKAHRSRLSSLGQLHQVVATTNVIRALTAVGPGQLVAAVVRTESSEYLVWVDMGSQATVAAFENARTWIAG